VPRARPPFVALAGAAVVVVVVVVGLLLVSRSSAPVVPTAAPSPSATPTVPAESPSPNPSPIPTATSVPVTPGPPVGETPVPCGTFDPACARMPVSGAGAVPFTPDVACGSLGQCTLKLDILFPRAAGPWPVVVAVPGGPAAPGIRSGLGEFAQLVAGQGAVVFVADYRESPEWAGGSPTTYQDIACAIRFARAHAAEYGGDGRRVTLVAHSLGPFFASTAALSADSFEPAPGTCLTTAGSTKPDAFIGIAGIYSQVGVTSGFLDSFFGGSQAAAPAAWAAGDPFAVIRQAGANRIPVRLIHGDMDINVRPQSSQDFEQALEAAGFASQLTVIPQADHNSVLQHRDTIRVVLETALGLR
jgi:acetyl esterase/lipase